MLAGTEDFINFPISGSTYTNGSFIGRDGSTWTFAWCRGDKVINSPTPGLHKGTTPLANLASGTLTGGCGTLSFDYMKMYTTTVQVDVIINGTVRQTITGTAAQNAVTNTGPLTINQGGNFTLKIEQNNFGAGQVAIDNITWTTYGGSDPEPPEILFSPDSTNIITAYSNLIAFAVTATEPNEDTVRLWAAGLPSGATFNASTGTTPLISAFSWRPTSAQTGNHSVIFYAGDKDGTNSRSFDIEVTPIYPYYHYAEGLTGTNLKVKLHEIISTGAVMLNDTQENEAMKDIHTDPANTNNILLLYNPTSSIPKASYNTIWNKEHCWPESRGLGNEGPDQVDIHNLYAEDKVVNALRGNLYFDDSDSAATNVPGAYPGTTMDGNSFEPPAASKGNVARAVFYMATRYDGNESDTSALYFHDNPTNINAMGILNTLLLWHAMDPPDDWERARNEMIYQNYQHNRNPFVDRPEWVEEIWGTHSDSDGITDTHEIIAGSDPNNSESVFEASISNNQVTCNLLSTGSVWRLYQGSYVSNSIDWHPIAETNRLQSGQLRFSIAPTSSATLYHLRAMRTE
ncbi:MAG: endonuclease [Kiritimatiellia bacterium]